MILSLSLIIIKYNVVERHIIIPLETCTCDACQNYNLYSLENTSEVSCIRFVNDSFLLEVSNDLFGFIFTDAIFFVHV